MARLVWDARRAERADAEDSVTPSDYERREGCAEPESDEIGEDLPVHDHGVSEAEVEVVGGGAEETQ